jgi:hypothetical protein
MAEYYVVLKRAVAAFNPGAGDQRRAVYDKARSALIGQLKAIDPPLTTAEISRQRLELEEAIRKVERESMSGMPNPYLQEPAKSARKPARKGRPELEDEDEEQDEQPPIDLEIDLEDEEEDAPPPKRKRKPEPEPEPARVAKARTRKITEPPPPEEDDYYEEEEAPPPPPRRKVSRPAPELRNDRDDYDSRGEPPLERHDDWSSAPPDLSVRGERDRGERAGRAAPRISDREVEERAPRRSRLPLILLLMLIVIAGVGAYVAYSRFPQVRNFVATIAKDVPNFAGSVMSSFNRPETKPAEAAKVDERAPDLSPAPTVRTVGPADPAPAAPSAAPAPPAASGAVPVAQSALLFEESMQRDGSVVGSAEGTVVWRFVPTGTDGPSLEANVALPSKNLTMQLSIRKNNDKSIPASHLLEIVVRSPPGFGGGGVVEVPRVVTKNADGSKTTPILGSPYKVADGLFWVLMSGQAKDLTANLASLKSAAFLDIPLVYKSGQRAIMTLTKGEQGEQAFNSAIKAWGG